MMDRMQIQLIAIERFFTNNKNVSDGIEQIEVTSVELSSYNLLWCIGYNVIYANGKVVTSHEMVEEAEEEENGGYDATSVCLFAEHGMKVKLM